MEVQIAIRGQNLDVHQDHNGWLINMQANERVEVQFPVGTVAAGTARLQVVGAGKFPFQIYGEFADASELELPGKFVTLAILQALLLELGALFAKT